MFDLPEPRRYRLARAPLVQAIVQVQFDLRARLQSLTGIAPFQDAVEAQFPYMDEERVQQITFGAGPAVPDQLQTDTTAHWKFTDDEGWILTVAPNVATLAVGATYQSVEEITQRFEVVLRALAEVVGVRRCNRLGVRYINAAEMPPADPRAWTRWFRQELTGWPGADLLKGDLSLALTQVQASIHPTGAFAGSPSDIQTVIRHGLLPPNTMIPGQPPSQREGSSFVLDVDVFVEGKQPLDPPTLLQQFKVFHSQIARFFRWTLSPAGEDHFGLEETQ